MSEPQLFLFSNFDSQSEASELSSAFEKLQDIILDQKAWEKIWLRLRHQDQTSERRVALKYARHGYSQAVKLCRRHDLIGARTLFCNALHVYYSAYSPSLYNDHKPVILLRAKEALADILFLEGNLREAATVYQSVAWPRPRRFDKEPRDVLLLLSRIQCRLGEIFLMTGEPDIAHNCLQNVVDMWWSLRYQSASIQPLILASFLSYLAHLHGHRDFATALQHYQRALKIVLVIKEPCMKDLASICVNLERFLNLQQQNPPDQKDSSRVTLKYLDLGLMSEKLRQWDCACLMYNNALKCYKAEMSERRHGPTVLTSFVAANAYFCKGRLSDRKGEYHYSRRWYMKALDIYMKLGPHLTELLRVDWRSLPTLAAMQRTLALSPSRPLLMGNKLTSTLWCYWLSKFGNDAQIVFYVLREAPEIYCLR